MRSPPLPVVNRPTVNRERFDAHTGRLLQRLEERQRALDAKKAGVAHGPAAPDVVGRS